MVLRYYSNKWERSKKGNRAYYFQNNSISDCTCTLTASVSASVAVCCPAVI